jgi:hypothetical protein
VKEEALDRTMWRAGFGRGFGTVVRQAAKRMMALSYTAGKKNMVYMYVCIYECF